jgi:hypothetical protein
MKSNRIGEQYFNSTEIYLENIFSKIKNGTLCKEITTNIQTFKKLLASLLFDKNTFILLPAIFFRMER